MTAIVDGEFEALLATVTLPGKLPVTVGAKVSVKVAACPGARIKPAETPLTEYCAPATVTLDTVTLEFPEFVRTTLNSLVFPIATLPKFKLVVLMVRKADAARPVPLSAMVLGIAEASLTTLTLPDKGPGVLGEKTTLNVTCLPAAIVSGSEIPVTVTPAAVALALVIVTFDVP